MSAQGETEHEYRTGDRVDVFFSGGGRDVTVVEAELEGEEELITGIHQAIKYRALAAAERGLPNVGPSTRVGAAVVAFEVDYRAAIGLAALYEVHLVSVDETLLGEDA